MLSPRVPKRAHHFTLTRARCDSSIAHRGIGTRSVRGSHQSASEHIDDCGKSARGVQGGKASGEVKQPPTAGFSKRLKLIIVYEIFDIPGRPVRLARTSLQNKRSSFSSPTSRVTYRRMSVKRRVRDKSDRGRSSAGGSKADASPRGFLVLRARSITAPQAGSVAAAT